MKDVSTTGNGDRRSASHRAAAHGIRHRLFLGFGSQTIAILLRIAQQLLVVPILIGAWGTDLYADWIVIVSTTSFFTILDFGLQAYFGNELLIAYSRHEFAAYLRLKATGIFVYLMIVLLAMACLAGASIAVSWPAYLAIHVMSGPGVLATAAVLSVSSLLLIPLGFVDTAYRAHGDYTRGIVINIAAEALRGFGICAAVLLRGTPFIAALVSLCITVLFGIGIFVDQHSCYGETWTNISVPTKAELWRAITRAPLYLSSSVSVPVVLNAPILLLGYLSGSSGAVVAYTVSRTLTGFMRQIVNQFCHPIGIEMARQAAIGDQSGQQRVLFAAGRMVSGSAGLLGGFTLVAANPFLRLWTHGKVNFDPWLVGTFVAAIILIAPAQVAAIRYLYNNKPTALVGAQIANAVAAVALCVALIGRFGATGAAVATSLGEFLSVGLILPYVTTKELSASPIQYFACSYVAALISFVLSYAVAQVGITALTVSGPIGLGELAVAWVFAITLPSFFVLLDARERAWLLTGIAKRFARFS